MTKEIRAFLSEYDVTETGRGVLCAKYRTNVGNKITFGDHTVLVLSADDDNTLLLNQLRKTRHEWAVLHKGSSMLMIEGTEDEVDVVPALLQLGGPKGTIITHIHPTGECLSFGPLENTQLKNSPIFRGCTARLVLEECPEITLQLV